MPEEPNDPPADKTYTQAELDAQIAGLRTKNGELIGKNKTLSERAALLGDRTAEEIQADLDIARKFKEDKLKAEGDFEALKTSLVDQHKNELEKANGRATKVEGKLYDVLAKREAEKALLAAGDKSTPKVMLPHVLPFIKVVEVEDDYVTQVVDAKGKQRYVGGEPMTIEQLVDEFKANEDFGSSFPASGTTGSGATQGVNGGGGRDHIISKADAQDTQKYRAARAAAEKAGVQLRIAG